MRSDSKVWTRGRGWAGGSEIGDAADLVLYFGAPGRLDDGERYDELRRAHPRARLVGCTTGGEILGTDVLDDSVVAVAVTFADTPLALSEARVATADDSFAAGVALARGLPPDGLRAVFVLSDGTRVNGSALVAGLRATLDASVVITGGLAGDGASFRRTLVGADRRPEEGVVVAVGLYGDRVRVGHGSAGGFETFGPERRITRSRGNVLAHLDGEPALALYKRYLGEHIDRLPGSALLFPLYIQRGRGEKPLVRTVLSIDEASQTMTFAGDIPEGARAWFMHGTHERLVEGAEVAAARAAPAHGSQLSVLVSCIGRKLLMGQRVADEVECAVERLGRGSTAIGFYSYGEICPSEGGFSDLHNQTMTVTTISEV